MKKLGKKTLGKDCRSGSFQSKIKAIGRYFLISALVLDFWHNLGMPQK